jgi:hypothetical protein
MDWVHLIRFFSITESIYLFFVLCPQLSYDRSVSVVYMSLIVMFLGSNQDVQNCMVCNLQSNFDLFRYILPIQYYCPHSKYFFSIKPSCKAPKRSLFGLSLFFLFLVVPLLSYIFNFSLACQTKQSFCYMFFLDELYIVCGIGFGVVTLLTTKNQIREITCWLQIFENRKFYHLQSIIHGNDVKKFKVYRGLSVFIIVINSVFLPFCFVSSYDSLPSSSVRKLGLSFCYAIQIKMSLEIIKRISLIGAILKAFKTSLRICFMDRLSTGSDPRNKCLMNILNKYQSLMRKLKGNIATFMQYVTIVLILWSTVYILLLIFYIFILIKYNDFHCPAMGLVLSRMFNAVIQMLMLLVRAEDDINKRVSLLFFS